MTPDEFITEAIRRGRAAGVGGLASDERLVYLISEAEVYCDMEGIDSLLDNYAPAQVAGCAAAFAEVGAGEIADTLARIAGDAPRRVESDLSRANAVITRRQGYGYDDIRAALVRRLDSEERPRVPR